MLRMNLENILAAAGIMAAISPAAQAFLGLPTKGWLAPVPARQCSRALQPSILSLRSNLPGGSGGMQGASVTKAKTGGDTRQ
jgi:hypothetical protein